MPTQRIDFPAFTKGIVSDAIGVAGAFEDADNIVPLGSGVWKQRSTKLLNAINMMMTTCNGVAHLASETAVNPYLVQGLTAGVKEFRAAPAGWTVGTISGTLGNGPLNAAGAAVTLTGLTSALYPNLEGLTTPTIFGGELLVTAPMYTAGVSAGQANAPMKWAGSILSTPYNTGTVAGTAGSTTVTLTGGAFVDAHVNSYIWMDTATVRNRSFRIVRRVSATVVQVDAPVEATFAATAFIITPLAPLAAKPGVFGGGFPGSSAVVTERGYVNAWYVCSHRGRVFALNCFDNDLVPRPSRLRWSGSVGETDGGQYIGSEYWHANGYADIDAFGTPFGLQSDGQYLYMITTTGVWALEGDVATDGTDLGASVRRILSTDGMVGLNAATTPMGVVFGGQQGLWVLSGGQARNLSAETGTTRMWESMFARRNGASSAGGLAVVGSDGERIIVMGAIPQLDALNAGKSNCAVYYIAEGVWVTQTTILSSMPVGPLGAGANRESTGAFTGRVFRWPDENDESSDVNENGRRNDVRVVTHALDFPSASRVRAIRAHLRVNTDIYAYVWTGVQSTGWYGTVTPEEESRIYAVTLPSGWGEGDRWVRMPLRVGTPPVSSVRVAFESNYDQAFRFYRLALEVVPVARIRS